MGTAQPGLAPSSAHPLPTKGYPWVWRDTHSGAASVEGMDPGVEPNIDPEVRLRPVWARTSGDPRERGTWALPLAWQSTYSRERRVARGGFSGMWGLRQGPLLLGLRQYQFCQVRGWKGLQSSCDPLMSLHIDEPS